MARGKTLLQLTEAVRNECRRSSNTSRGVDALNNIKQVIKRVYETVYDEFDWPHLNVTRDITTNAGQIHYDFPDDLLAEDIDNKVKFLYGSQWQDVSYGIDADDYTIFNSDNDERSDPILKWDILNTGTEGQIEVWPRPKTSAKIRLKGKKSFVELVTDSDVCLLDSVAITLIASSEILQASESPDWQTKRDAGYARLNRVRARITKSKRYSLSGEDLSNTRSTPHEIEV